MNRPTTADLPQHRDSGCIDFASGTGTHRTPPLDPNLSSTRLVDVIVLVMSRSELRVLTGTDALRVVLAGSIRELRPEPGRLELQPLWDLLADQPGFEPERALGPMCRLKLWESRLGLVVVLPEALRDLDDSEVLRHARRCVIDEYEVERKLSPAATRTIPITTIIEVIPVVNEAPPRPRSRRRLVAAGVAACIAIAVATFSLLRPTPTSTTEITPSAISSELVLTSVHQHDHGIVAQVADAQVWRLLPTDRRRDELETAGRNARALGASELLLVDHDGALLARVSLRDEPTVMFPESAR